MLTGGDSFTSGVPRKAETQFQWKLLWKTTGRVMSTITVGESLAESTLRGYVAATS